MRARLILPALAVLATTAAAHAASGVSLTATENAFSPKSATVAVGDKVTWTNRGQAPHEVTATDGSFASGNIAPGASYSWTTTKAGTISYYCRYHGTATSGMVGTLSVGSASALPKTGGGRELAIGLALLTITAVVGGGLRVATREGSTR